MTESPYIRHGLKATNAGTLPWLEALHHATNPIVLWGRLARADPARWSESVVAPATPTFEQLLFAFKAIDLQVWADDLARLDDEMADGPITGREAVVQASALLTALDDAELLWYAARKAGCEPADLREQLDRAIRHLVHLADALVPAGERIQAMAFIIRPDLETHDPDLAATARKFVYLLDHLEKVEADGKPLAPWVIERQPGLVLPAQSPSSSGRIPALKTVFALAASSREAGPVVPPFRWHSADGTREARLDIPRYAPTHGLLFVEFDGADLAGQPVVLGGLRSVVDAQGRAAFAWEEIRAVERLLGYLRVGSAEEWTLRS